MSSSNIDPDETVISVENDAIPNQSREEPEGNRQASPTADNPDRVTQEPTALEKLKSCLLDDGVLQAIFTIAYLDLILLSLFLGTTYYIFPILFPISLCSLYVAANGYINDNYYFFKPLMLTVAWNTIYAIICFIFYISFYGCDKEFFLNKALYFCWAEKAEIIEGIVHSWHFVHSLTFIVFEIFIGIGTFFVTKHRYAKLKKRNVEEIRRIYGEELAKIVQQGGLILENPFLYDQHHTAQSLSNERTNPIAELLAQIPPPPPYQSRSTLSNPQTPQNGTPPPTYSMLEREDGQLESAQFPATQQSINTQLSDTTQTSNDTFYSLSTKSSNDSTAMSPSSILD